MNTTEFIKKIKDEKTKQKLTSKQLSLKSGVPLGTLNKILSLNTKSVKLETQNKLLSALALSGGQIQSDGQNQNFGYIKVGAYTPKISVADVTKNLSAIKVGIDESLERGVKILVFPELCITGCTCGDLFYQQTLLDSALNGLFNIVNYSIDKQILIFVGLPIKKDGKLYNVAVAILNGEILGFTPKTILSNGNEASDCRYFNNLNVDFDQIELNEKTYPFSKYLIYSSREQENLTVCAEIGIDLLCCNAPSSSNAQNGGMICVNLSANNELVGGSENRRAMLSAHTKVNNLGYVYANAGFGESTTDLVFSGNSLILENGKILNDSGLFRSGLICSDIDLDLLSLSRIKRPLTQTAKATEFKKVYFSLELNGFELDRKYSKTPFIPQTQNEIDQRAELILSMQSYALAQRIQHVNPKTIVIGVSGGLDSTLALLVAVRALKILGRSSSDVLAITMPCFGTTTRTKNNAENLSNSFGVTLKEINIKKSVLAHFKDIEQDPTVTDITFENSQARERTQVLMDIANKTGGIVIGTGDLSELALGWATYNGDHMSMYGVNSSIPKTLIRHLVRYEAIRSNKSLKETLLDILDTPVSPELIPPKDGEIVQKTEDIVGPYLLHDFYLYYVIKYCFKPSKIFYIAKNTFKNEFDDATLLKWLKNFYNRFFNQQFKRSCLPDGVKIGSVGLSPRGGFIMPSDAVKNEWLKDVENIKI